MFGKDVRVELPALLPGDFFGVAELALFRLWITDVIAGPWALRCCGFRPNSSVPSSRPAAPLCIRLWKHRPEGTGCDTKTMPFFHDFEIVTLAHIVQLFEVRSFEPETTLVRQATAPRSSSSSLLETPGHKRPAARTPRRR